MGLTNKKIYKTAEKLNWKRRSSANNISPEHITIVRGTKKCMKIISTDLLITSGNELEMRDELRIQLLELGSPSYHRPELTDVHLAIIGRASLLRKTSIVEIEKTMQGDRLSMETRWGLRYLVREGD
jgi:hypothetical protein